MPTNEQTIPSQYVEGFKANLNILPQQMRPRLVTNCDADMSYNVPGKMFNADDVGTSDPVDVETRVADTPDGFIDMHRRVNFFTPFHDAKWLDNVDKARELVDPTNQTMQAIMAGRWRKADRAIIAAALSPFQYEGEQAQTQVAFPAAQIIADNDRTFVHQDEVIPAAGAYSLSIGKITFAKVKLDAAELDDVMESERFLVVNAAQLGHLLSTTPATNNLYNDVKALVQGTISKFMGFNIIRSELLPTIPAGGIAGNASSAGSVRCIAYAKPALVYRSRPITNARIAIRHDKSDTPQAFYKAEHGALRRYDVGVVEIDCAA